MIILLVPVIVISTIVIITQEKDTPSWVSTQEEARHDETGACLCSVTCPRNSVIWKRRRAEEARREALRVRQCEAFAMGQQERLGEASRVIWLDPGVVRMVLDYV
jgi:hypothetical protein